jgi:AcrR family transcriptional regulator
VSLLPPRASADGTHRRLQEEALIRFGERGFHGVSVREIAQAAGVQASSVYSHLASKEELLFQLMFVGHEEHHEAMRHALLEADADPVSQVRHIVDAHVRFHADYPLLARVCNREMAALSPASREKVVAIRRQSEQLFLDVIQRGVRLGVFDVPDPWLAAAAILAGGLRVCEWWGDEIGYSVDDVVTAYQEFSTRMLVPRPT